MDQIHAFNAEAMRRSAVSTRNAFAGVSNTKFQRVSDCGSALVAETVAFFLDKLESSLLASESRAERLAQNIRLTAKDFVSAESENRSNAHSLIDSLNGIR